MLRTWFSAPTFEDEYRTFAARVLHYTLLLLIGVVVTFMLFATSVTQLIYIPAIILIFGICYWLLHTNHYALASGLFLSGFWLVITFASFSLNGIRNASFSSYAIVIIFAAILFSDRVVIFAMTLSILSGIVLVVGELQGILPLRTTTLFLADRFFQQVALFGSTGILLSAASHVIRVSFNRIRLNEQLLMERNRTLEGEIIERQRIEVTLRASEEKYRLLFENTNLMCVVYDQAGTILLINEMAAQQFKTTAQALQGQTLYTLFPQTEAERLLQRQTHVIATQIAEITEGKTTWASGEEFYYLRNVVPLPQVNNSQLPQVLVITTDITKQKNAEQHERELILSREKNVFLTDFLGTISHDFKTPLTVLNTSLYLLERMQNTDDRQQRVAQMKEQVALLDGYIQDMLMIARLEHLPLLNTTTLDINPLIEGIANLLRPRLEKKQITYQFAPQSKTVYVAGDQEQIHRALVNLMENAINYTPANGQVSVSTGVQNGHVLVEITDTGIGIKPEDLPHIFDRFYRATEARAFAHSGTGLGLAIVKKIIDIHHGNIEVDSQPGQGTSFRIQLPREAQLSPANDR